MPIHGPKSDPHGLKAARKARGKKKPKMPSRKTK